MSGAAPTEFHCVGCGAPWRREHVEACAPARRARLAVIAYVAALYGGGGGDLDVDGEGDQ